MLVAVLVIQVAWFAHRQAQLPELVSSSVLETGPPTVWEDSPPGGWSPVVRPGSGLIRLLPGSFVNPRQTPVIAYLTGRLVRARRLKIHMVRAQGITHKSAGL